MESIELEWPWEEYDEGRAKRAAKVKFRSIDGEKALTEGDKPGEGYETTLIGCTCQDFRFNLRGLKPCKHIYALGIALGLLDAAGRTPEQHRQAEIAELHEKIARAAGYYYILGEVIIPDSEYDSLKSRLRELALSVEEEEKEMSKIVYPDMEGYMLALRLLDVKDVSYIDNTPNNGALWILDSDPQSPLIAELTAATGLKFTFSIKGGAVSDHKPAWYYRPYKPKEGKRKKRRSEPKSPAPENSNVEEIAALRQRIATASGFYHVFHAPICDDATYDSMKAALAELETQ